MERSFRFTMMGIMIGIAISTGTCYLASQLYPLLYLFLGWGEAAILTKPAPAEELALEPATAGFRMTRVIA
jgi:hypothetical protein